jgi:hypothetical protein
VPILLYPDALADGPDLVRYLAALGPAVLNVGTHALVRRRFRRRAY